MSQWSLNLDWQHSKDCLWTKTFRAASKAANGVLVVFKVNN